MTSFFLDFHNIQHLTSFALPFDNATSKATIMTSDPSKTMFVSYEFKYFRYALKRHETCHLNEPGEG